MSGRLPPPPGTHERICGACGEHTVILHADARRVSRNPLTETFEAACDACGADVRYVIGTNDAEPTTRDASALGRLRRRILG